MTDRDGLHRAVLENPDEDVPRLVYADELDSLGGKPNHARATFIRAGIASVRNPTYDAINPLRERALLRQWHARWFPKPLRFDRPRDRVEGRTVWNDVLGGYVVFQRGFIEAVGVELPWRADGFPRAIERFGTHLRAIFSSNPVREVRVSFEGSARVFTAEIDKTSEKGWRVKWSDETVKSVAGVPLNLRSDWHVFGRRNVGAYLPRWFQNRLDEPVILVRAERQAEIEDDEWDAANNPDAWTYSDEDDEERAREAYNRRDWDWDDDPL